MKKKLYTRPLAKTHYLQPKAGILVANSMSIQSDDDNEYIEQIKVNPTDSKAIDAKMDEVW